MEVLLTLLEAQPWLTGVAADSIESSAQQVLEKVMQGSNMIARVGLQKEWQFLRRYVEAFLMQMPGRIRGC